jgi:1-deoxy-D-xylulose-5-phosphate reductoisomerase
MKNILILGSTGSIGKSTLDVVRQFPDHFKVTGLTAHSNVDLLKSQIEEFKPEYVAISDENAVQRLNFNRNFELYSGEQGLLEITQNCDYDILLSSLVGFAGLAPTIEAIKRRKRIALANKETLVVAGQLINDLCKKYDAEMIPVDSEHSAIFQCLIGEKPENVRKLILTASGGPFREHTIEQLKNVTVAEALNHPNWDMGSKITIDSATMMNKGLEVIEAKWLFDLTPENIEVVVHPQSIIHSMVEFTDGSIKAQLSVPDMKLPIIYALSYPDRIRNNFTNTNFSKIKFLTFFEPDFSKFTCLKLAFDVLEQKGTTPCILNAANEVAVDQFLKEQISFVDIPKIVQKSLDHIENNLSPDLETIIECDRKTREFAANIN